MDGQAKCAGSPSEPTRTVTSPAVKAAADPGSPARVGRERPAVQGGAVTQHPILRSLDGGAGQPHYTGDDLMNEVYELMLTRLPQLAVDDPDRPRVMRLLPAMATALGRVHEPLLQAAPVRRGA